MDNPLLRWMMQSHPYADANLRQPYPGEAEYFQKNPSVGGMAADDGRVTLNPFSGLTASERDAVYRNEQARLLMRGTPDYAPPPITPQQSTTLGGTTYANASDADRQATMAARVFSGDPSAGTPTAAQERLARALGVHLGVRGAPFNYTGNW